MLNEHEGAAPIVVTDRANLLALVPYLLGFHPTDSLVLVGLADKRVMFCGRMDLSWPTADVVAWLFATLRHTPVGDLLVIGYGQDTADAAITAVVTAVGEHGLRVRQSLRVTGERYHCLLCADCVPPGGARFDAATTVTATQATVLGLVARPSRDDVTRLAAPVTGPAAQAMRQELSLGRDWLATLDERTARDTINAALRQAETGTPLDDQLATRMVLLLHVKRYRDHAWLRSDSRPWQLELWLDLTRRGVPDLVAPAASLAAWCAWRRGDGVTARVALNRALQAEPGYQLADMLAVVLDSHVPPSVCDPWPPHDLPDNLTAALP